MDTAPPPPRPPQGQAYTSPRGPVLIAERSLRALAAIRKLPLLEKRFGQVALARSVHAAVSRDLPPLPNWLIPVDDQPHQSLPQRVANANPADRATLQLALAIPASLVLIDGPIKEQAKLSFIKCEGVVSILVQAYRQGQLSAVEPMLKALRSLGYEDVLPPEDLLNALRAALKDL